MSTLPGLASKGEKGKPRFQSLDINNIYKNSRGESSEPHQQKSTLPRKHGMQQLGRVPSARRPPANLPSLKSEHSGNDPAVSLVPSGGTGWGTKPGETAPSPTSQQNTQSSTSATTVSSTGITSSGAPVVAPSSVPPQVSQQPSVQPQQVVSTGDKTWSSVMTGGESAPSYLAHQSPLFQQEFPSLSGEVVGPGPPNKPSSDTQYGPGPSLRPQTEGSWTHGGGSRGGQGSTQTSSGGNQQSTAPSQDGGVRSNLGQFGVGGVPGGPASSVTNYNSVFPSFMSQREFPTFSGNIPNTATRPRNQYPEQRAPQGSRPPPLITDPEELMPRPIIKEEDLDRIHDLARDPSWAAQDEIDYNQKLAFSDEESGDDEKETSEKKDTGKEKGKPLEVKEEKKLDIDRAQEELREKPIGQPWSRPSPGDFRASNRSPLPEKDDEYFRKRRRELSENLVLIAERATQRKLEEEIRFEESQAKVQAEVEKIKSNEESSGNDQSSSSVTPSTSDWDPKDKADKLVLSSKEATESFRQMTHIDNRSMKEMRNNEPHRNFGQRNVAPRFQNLRSNQHQQCPRQNQLPDSRSFMESGPHFYGNKNSMSGVRKNRADSDMSDKESEHAREEDRDRGRDRNAPELSDRGLRGGRMYGYHGQSDRYHDQRNKDFDFNKTSSNKIRGSDPFLTSYFPSSRRDKESDQEWDKERHYDPDRSHNRRPDLKKEFFKPPDACDSDWRTQRPDSRDRPQRPDSRDSRASRDSRNSRDSNRDESRSIQGSADDFVWQDNDFDKDSKKEEKSFRKEGGFLSYDKEERRDMAQSRQRGEGHVPGPITKEKMEAYEHKHSLTDKEKTSVLGGVGLEEDSWPKSQVSMPWAETNEEEKSQQNQNSSLDVHKESSSDKLDKDDGDKKKDLKKEWSDKSMRGGGGRVVRGSRQGYQPQFASSYGRSGNWNGRNDPKRGPSKRMPSQKQPQSFVSESDNSGDEISASTESGKEEKKSERKPGPRSPKSKEGRRSDKENKKESQSADGDKSSGSGGATPKQERKQPSSMCGPSGESRNEREGSFAPRGKPTRLGRGGGFRARGIVSNVHYGLPGSKSPFPSQSVADKADDDDKCQDVDSSEDKIKIKQQALSAGLSANKGKLCEKDLRKPKGKPSPDGDDAWETTSETSDLETKGKKPQGKHKTERKPPSRNPPGEKKGLSYSTSQMNGGRPGRIDDFKDDSDKKKESSESVNYTNNGFQEVRSKKNGSAKDTRPMKDDPKRVRVKSGTKEKFGNQGGQGRGQGPMKLYPRGEWNTNKPPRMQRMENILRKQQQQQQQQQDVNDMNKINVSLFPITDSCSAAPPAPPPSVNAWDKPITASLRPNSPAQNALQLGTSLSSAQDKTIELNDQSGGSSPSAEKALSKLTRDVVDKSRLDGTSAPVQTIIFENTNFKGDMGAKSRYMKGQRMDKGRGKLDEDLDDTHLRLGGFKPGDLKTADKQDSIEMPLSFTKNEDSADMKLDFPFDSELGRLTDDKSNISRSLNLGQTSAADLNQKIASVKKVWDTPGSVMDQHHVDESHVGSSTSSFTLDSALDPSGEDNFSASDYSSGPQIQGSNSYATAGQAMMKNDPNSASNNMCKMASQVASAAAAAAISSAVIGQHPGTSTMSPPPNFTQTAGHMSYPVPPVNGIPPTPSPPTPFMYGSTPQAASGGDMYSPFMTANPPVGSSRFSNQYPTFGISQGMGQTSTYSGQPVTFLQTPPSAEVFSSFRLPTGYAPSQQISNQPNSTMLMSSSSNSLMSATVKSSTQPVGSKGTYQGSAAPMYYQISDTSLLAQNFTQLRHGNVLPMQAPSSSFYSAGSAGQTPGMFPAPTSAALLGNAASIQHSMHSATGQQFSLQGYNAQSAAQSGPGSLISVPNYGSQMVGHYRGQGATTTYMKPGVATAQHGVDSKSQSGSQDNQLLGSINVFSIPPHVTTKFRADSGKQQSSNPQQPSPTQSHHNKFSNYPSHSVSQGNLVMPQQHLVTQQVAAAQHSAGQRGVVGSGVGVRSGSGNQSGGNSGQNQTRFPTPIQRPMPSYSQQPMMQQQTPRHRIQPSRQQSSVNKLPPSHTPNQYFQQQSSNVKLETPSLETKADPVEMKIPDSSASTDKVKEEPTAAPEQ